VLDTKPGSGALFRYPEIVSNRPKRLVVTDFMTPETLFGGTCDFQVGNAACGRKAPTFRRGMLKSVNGLTVIGPNGAIYVICLCEDHAALLLRQALGENPAPLP
jgi:hypothetical protein